jgi:hypothetical protein
MMIAGKRLVRDTNFTRELATADAGTELVQRSYLQRQRARPTRESR